MMSIANVKEFAKKRLEKINYGDTDAEQKKIIISIYDDLEKEGVDSKTIKTVVDNIIIERILELSKNLLKRKNNKSV